MQIRTRILAVALLLFSATMVSILAPVASGQLPPIKPAPLSQQVPQGQGGCSVGKSCAELAPQMEQTALGTSPLEENLRYLTDSIGGRGNRSPAGRPGRGRGGPGR